MKPDEGKILYWLYLVLLLASLLIVGKIVYFQYFWKPDPGIGKALTPRNEKVRIEPRRGDIIDCKGRLLAMTYPVYDLHIDCTVQDPEVWANDIEALCSGLREVLGGDAATYSRLLRTARRDGKRYLPLAKRVDLTTLNRVRALPIFCKGTNKGGLIVSGHNIRKYPYGRLARRTIGFVRDNSSSVRNTHIGLEGRFDSVLHGQDGEEHLRITDYGRVRDFDSTYTRAVDGQDLRTTIDMDFQEFADEALREQIDSLADIDGGCLVVMEVHTGAIRAMVNLQRNSAGDNALEEITNHAIGRRFEPGSVFKTVTLLTAIEDGKIKSLRETMPTNHGVVKGTKMRQDIHIPDWERDHHTSEISIYDGFKISSNYVLGSIAVNNYRNDTRHFLEKIYSYGLGDPFDFDLDGLQTPKLPAIPAKRENLDATTLGQLGFGYASEMTPLHILAFYNGIAGKGRQMKPYLVEDVERHGTPTDMRGPAVMNASMCRRASADSVTVALMAVIEEGTAKRLRAAKCKVAGKTGTSFATFENGRYEDAAGRKKYQGTFVGFFPAEDPQYSIICCIYSKPTRTQYQGGGIPAKAVLKVVNHLVDTQPYWQQKLEKGAAVPRMSAAYTVPEDNGEGIAMPDFKGLGLKDALFLAENAGFACSYTGMGQVAKQSPAAGTRVKKGTTVNIELK